MFNYSALSPVSEMFYYFSQIGEEKYCWKILDVNNSLECIGSLIEADDDILMKLQDEDAPEDVRTTILEDFDNFKNRPEYTFYNSDVEIEGQNAESLIATYEQLLYTATICRCLRKKSSSVSSTPAVRLIEWLRTTDFYTAPASTRYHEAVPSGLLVHSLKVYKKCLALQTVPEFQEVPWDSLTLLALSHDFCKINKYENYKRNVKNEVTGQWEQVDAYRYSENKNSVVLGHGDSSMFIVSRFYSLSVAEACAIRWHMGRWYVADSDMNDLQSANEQFPEVHLLQFADQLAITDYACI